jgi:hypothetical protein
MTLKLECKSTLFIGFQRPTGVKIQKLQARSQIELWAGEIFQSSIFKSLNVKRKAIRILRMAFPLK